MSHTFTQLTTHIVFSTRDRRNLIAFVRLLEKHGIEYDPQYLWK